MTGAERSRKRRWTAAAGLGSVAVAFSGGVDSAYLAARAHRVLGARALAVTAVSPSLAEAQRPQAGDVARALRLRPPLRRDLRGRRPPLRRERRAALLRCKTELFAHLLPLAACAASRTSPTASSVTTSRTSVPAIARPPRRACVSPLAEAGLTKADVRALSRAAGPAHLGPALLALPVVAHPLRHRRSRPGSCAQVERAESGCARWASGSCASATSGRRARGAFTGGAGAPGRPAAARSGRGRRTRGRLPEPRRRSRGLPAGPAERGPGAGRPGSGG